MAVAKRIICFLHMLRNKGFLTAIYDAGIRNNPGFISESLESDEYDINAQDWIGSFLRFKQAKI